MLTDYLQDERRSARGRRHLAVVTVVLLLAGLVAAATKDTSSARPATAAELVVLRQAGERASSVTTARVEFRFDFQFGGRRLVTLMKGVIDNQRQLGAFDLTFPEAPAGARLPAGIQLLGAGDTAFLSIPEDRRDRTGGKAWASTPVPAQNALAATGASPGQYLDALTELAAPGSSAERIGDEDVRGVPTVHYRVEIDLQRVAQNADQAQLEQLKQVGASTMPMDVYLDDAGIPRRTTARLEGRGFSFDFTYEVYDVGKPVAVPEPPAADDTVSVPSVQALFQLLA